MGGRRLGGRALPGSWGGRCRALKDESDMVTGRGRMFFLSQSKCKDETRFLRELVDGVVEVTGVRFI